MMRIISGVLALAVSFASTMLPWGSPRTFLAAADAAQSTTTQITAYNLGSPSFFGDLLFSSGALTATQASSSVIYEANTNLIQVSQILPFQAFALPGYHVSDPSVISAPGTENLLMYYTKLSDADAATSTAALHNQIGLARSSSDGRRWTDSGVVVGQNNTIDTRGGWAPSAIYTPNSQLWLYFSTNGPGNIAVYRATLDPGGQQVINVDRVYAGEGTSTPLSLFNVDVSWDGSQYVMLANPNLSSIVKYTSNDGLHWEAPDSGATVLSADSTSIISAPTTQRDQITGETKLLFASGARAASRWDTITEISTQQITTPATYSHVNNSITEGTPPNTNQDNSNSNGESSGGTIVAVAGLLGIAGIVAYSLFGGAATVAVPVAASTVTSNTTGISFGGLVASMQPCNSGLLLYIKSAVFPYAVIPVMWLTGELPFLSHIPPHIGQQLLGKLAPVPLPCFLGPVPYGVGLPILFHGASI